MKIFNFNAVKNYKTNLELVINKLQESVNDQMDYLKQQIKEFKKTLERYEVTEKNEIDFLNEIGTSLEKIDNMKRKIESWEKELNLIEILKNKKEKTCSLKK